MVNDYSRYRLFPLVLALAGFIVYIPALSAPFVYDDRLYILHNETIRSLSNLGGLSGTRYIGFLSFALNYHIGGYTPFDFHLTNVIIHIINSILVFYLVHFTARTPVLIHCAGRQPGLSFSVAAAVSLIFLTHPVQTQAVTYITQRFASLATLFYLLSIVLYVKSKLLSGEGRAGRSLFAYACSLFSAVLAMKTKEISFTLPFMIVLYDYIFFRGRAKRDIIARVPFYLTLLIIPLTLLAGGGDAVTEGLRALQLKEAAGLPRDIYVITQFRVIVTYMRLLLFPAWQKIDYDYPLSHSFFEPATLLSLLLLMTVLGAAIYVFSRSRRSANACGLLFSFGVFWWFLALSVESFAVPIQDVIFEQRVYLPGAGFMMAAVAAVFYFVSLLKERFSFRLSARALTVFFIIAILAPLAYLTNERNRVWQDEMKLLKEAIGETCRKSRLYYIRAMLLVEKGDFRGALKDAQKAISMNEKSPPEMYNMRGFALSELGGQEEALKDFARAIDADPGYFLAYYNRGRSLLILKRYKEAVKDFSMATGLKKKYPEAYNNRGIAYYGLGEREKAAADFRAACSAGYRNGCDNLRVMEGEGKGRPVSDNRP